MRFNKKPWFLVLVLCCIFMSFKWKPGLQLYASEKEKSVTVLLWYWPFNRSYGLEDDLCLKNYSVTGCRLVDNRTFHSIADIVVFHHYELVTGSQKLPLHLPRPVQQRWVWLSLEAPRNSWNVSRYTGIFNLTMSYHPGADITVPYGKIKEKGFETDSFFMLKNKTYLACWVVSNYQNQHRRSKVYKQLRKLIPVQVYGRAVRKPLNRDALLPTISRCYFYLAFENTESPHYITEKLWRNSFMAGTVPVVLGPPRSHYEAVTPPRSFIHVDDFDSIASLARFLTEVAGDTRLYRSYFSWHQNYTVKLFTDWRERLCNICQVYDQLPHHKIRSLLET
ncbi:Alpha-(1,3)-fucosyltransferase 7 [Bagarius yarrelli]|uniref:Fucosyltransferase n=1 Tax=Bagarius yarrelli TaxID=175774 RepID=A0A556TUA3_BAGYA|nr:Alpha-(1,3)-fucosyltransferase 7 [Bagarius yarrelli]